MVHTSHESSADLAEQIFQYLVLMCYRIHPAFSIGRWTGWCFWRREFLYQFVNKDKILHWLIYFQKLLKVKEKQFPLVWIWQLCSSLPSQVLIQVLVCQLTKRKVGHLQGMLKRSISFQYTLYVNNDKLGWSVLPDLFILQALGTVYWGHCPWRQLARTSFLSGVNALKRDLAQQFQSMLGSFIFIY